MTLIRRLASALCLAFLFTSYSNSQEILTTGNIVIPTTTSSGSTWTGAVYQDQLTCWRGGDPGYCGPSAIVRPGNSLNFSYGSTYVYQQQHITNILPSGTGLQVNGYNFSFTAKNGNGWDDGRTDSLTALVRFWDNTGNKGANNLLYGNSYNLNYKFNWTTFNYSETFSKALAVPEVGLVQYGFIGRDNNGWAGPYGPEVYNVNFSVKYSVDPCVSNVFYSPTCPGYSDALAKLVPAPAPTATTTVVEPIPAPVLELPSLATNTVAPATNSSPLVSNNILPPPSAPALAQSSTPAASTPTTSTPVAQQERSSSSPANLSFALNLIARNQEREKAIEQQAVQSALSEAQTASTKLQEQVSQTVATLNSMSAASVETGTALASASQQSGSAMVASSSGGSSNQQNSQNQFTGNGIQLNTQRQVSAQLFTAPVVTEQSYRLQELSLTNSTSQAYQQTSVLLSAPDTSRNATQTTTFASQEQRQFDVEIPQASQNFISDRTNPLRDILEAAPITVANIVESNNSSSVNRTVQDNQLAGGSDIARMAVVPVGYASYSISLVDSKLYDAKPIYQNQRVIDNVRLLRGLGSDLKHQQMVQDQYR